MRRPTLLLPRRAPVPARLAGASAGVGPGLPQAARLAAKSAAVFGAMTLGVVLLARLLVPRALARRVQRPHGADGQGAYHRFMLSST